MEVIDLLKDGAVWSREELVFFTEKDDRAVREDIHSLRRRGIPVMGLKSGGYKLATTDIEKQEMLHQLKGRALDLLKTYSVMTKAMQVEGQMSLEELLMSALGINTLADAVEDAPTIDAVKVVRCKDCIRHGKWNCPCSETPPAEFWCRSGERRTE